MDVFEKKFRPVFDLFFIHMLFFV